MGHFKDVLLSHSLVFVLKAAAYNGAIMQMLVKHVSSMQFIITDNCLQFYFRSTATDNLQNLITCLPSVL